MLYLVKEKGLQQAQLEEMRQIKERHCIGWQLKLSGDGNRMMKNMKVKMHLLQKELQLCQLM